MQYAVVILLLLRLYKYNNRNSHRGKFQSPNGYTIIVRTEQTTITIYRVRWPNGIPRLYCRLFLFLFPHMIGSIYFYLFGSTERNKT